MDHDDLQAKEGEIQDLLFGLCSAPERYELAIAGLRTLLADVQAHLRERVEGPSRVWPFPVPRFGGTFSDCGQVDEGYATWLRRWIHGN